MNTLLALFAMAILDPTAPGIFIPPETQATPAPKALPPVICLERRPDGMQYLAAAGADLLVITKAPKQTDFSIRALPLVTNPQRITALAYSPDGQKIAIAEGIPGQRGAIRILESNTLNKVLWKTEDAPHKDLILALAWSADGTRLASTGHDRLVLIHDVSAKNAPVAIRDHSDAVTAVTFLGNSPLISSSYDRVVKVFDAKDGKRRQTFADATDWLYAVTSDPTSKTIISGGKDKLLRVYKTQKDGTHILSSSAFAHAGPILQIAYSPDGKQLFSLGEDKTIKVWDAESLTQKGSPVTLDAFSHRFAISPETSGLLVGDQQGKITLLNGPGYTKKTILWPQPPAPPKITKSSPSYLPAGKETIIRIEGTALSQVQFQADKPTVTIRPVQVTDTVADLSVTVAPGQHTEDKATIGVSFDKKPLPPITLEVDRFPRTTLKPAESRPNEGMSPSHQRLVLKADQVKEGATLEGVLERPGFSWTIIAPLIKGQPLGVELLPPNGSAGWIPELECFRPDGSSFIRGKTILGITADQPGNWEFRVRDEQWRGGPQNSFRLEIGPIPVYLGAFPKVIQSGPSGFIAKVRFLGVHLPMKAIQVPNDGKPGQTLNPSLPATGVRPAGKVTLVYSSTGETTNRSQVLEPGINGQFLLEKTSPQVQWDFKAKKGEPIVLQVEARRHDSPLDPYLEILDIGSNPVQRARLQAIAKTNVTFRDHNSSQPGIRIDTWGDLLTNDYLLAGNDILRIRNLPRNPDDDCVFYSSKNRRLAYLGTTPVHHPNGQEMFRLKIHPPGTPLSENGMPIVDLPWFNDDGDPEFPKDSRILFHPPHDGVFRARISEAQGESNLESYGRLVIRKAVPDYQIRAQRVGNWLEGSSALVQVSVDRIDGFQGPVDLNWQNQSGWQLPASRVGPDDEEVIIPIHGAPGIASATTKDPLTWKLIASAKIGNQTINREVTITSAKPTAPYGLTVKSVTGEIQVSQGGKTRCTFEIIRPEKFQGRVPIEFKGLPFGCKVLDIGLNGILMIPGETRRTVEIACEDWVQPGRIPFVITARQEGKDEVTTTPLILEITKP